MGQNGLKNLSLSFCKVKEGKIPPNFHFKISSIQLAEWPYCLRGEILSRETGKKTLENLSLQLGKVNWAEQAEMPGYRVLARIDTSNFWFRAI